MDLEQEKRREGSSTTGGTPRSPRWDWGEDVTDNAGDDNNFEQVARLFHSHAQGDDDAFERHDYMLVFRRKPDVAAVVSLRKT